MSPIFDESGFMIPKPMLEEDRKVERGSRFSTFRKTSSGENKYPICPHCGQSIRPDRLQKHIAKVHGDQLKRHGKICRICHVRLAPDEVELHLRNYHSQASDSQTYVVDESGFIIGKPRTDNTPHPGKKVQKNPKPIVHKFVTCPSCHATLKESNLDFHIRMAHSPKSSAPQTKKNPQGRAFFQGKKLEPLAPRKKWEDEYAACPVCKVQVRRTRLHKHIYKVHERSDAAPSAIPGKIKKDPRPATQQTQKKKSISGGWSEQHVHALDALRQSIDEQRDGSKGLGHFRRESSGQFGSFPLHDDYGDESEA